MILEKYIMYVYEEYTFDIIILYYVLLLLLNVQLFLHPFCYARYLIIRLYIVMLVGIRKWDFICGKI